MKYVMSKKKTKFMKLNDLLNYTNKNNKLIYIYNK
jgi:hypothetical protein